MLLLAFLERIGRGGIKVPKNGAERKAGDNFLKNFLAKVEGRVKAQNL